MNRMCNIGIIGYGWIVRKDYIPLLMCKDGVNVTGIFDTVNVPNEYGIRTYETPNYLHSYYTDLALARGKHVLCEKPIALSRSDFEQSLHKAKKHEKILLPSFMNRFRLDILEFNKLVPMVGRISRIEASWIRKSGIPRSGTWITNKKMSGGGVFVDIGSHLLDICLMHIKDKSIKSVNAEVQLCGTSQLLSADWYNKKDGELLPVDVEKDISGNILFTDIELEFALSWSADDVEEDTTKFSVTGEAGRIELDTLFGCFSTNVSKQYIRLIAKLQNGQSSERLFPMKNEFSMDAFKGLIDYFICSVNGQKMDYLSPEDGLHTVTLIEQVYKFINII